MNFSLCSAQFEIFRHSRPTIITKLLRKAVNQNSSEPASKLTPQSRDVFLPLLRPFQDIRQSRPPIIIIVLRIAVN